MAKRGKSRIGLATVIIIVLITVVTAPMGLLNQLQVYGSSCAAYFLSKAGFSENYITANDRLRDENQNLAYLLNDRETRNYELQKKLNLIQEATSAAAMNKWKLIPARVVYYDPQASSNRVVLNRGTKQGVYAGALVLHGKYLYGKVLNAEKSTCEVLLLNDSRAIFPVFVGKEQLAAKIKGNGKGNALEVHYIDHQPENIVSRGFIVTTSPYNPPGEPPIPEGIPVGTVMNDPLDDTRAYDHFLRIKVQPYVNTLSARNVFILDTGYIPPQPEDEE